jgi:hypothetical protein
MVSAFVDDRPSVRFPVTGTVQPDGVLQEIKPYINDQRARIAQTRILRYIMLLASYCFRFDNQ